MSGTASSTSQKFKRWILLAGAVIAIAIWVRNLTILFSSTPSVSNNYEKATAVDAPTDRRPVPHQSSFHDSVGWRDFFIADYPRPRRPTVKQAQLPPEESRPANRVEPPPWEVIGIVGDRSSPAAILSSTEGEQQIVVSKGDSVCNARVERIADTIVWLRQGRHKWKLALDRTSYVVP